MNIPASRTEAEVMLSLVSSSFKTRDCVSTASPSLRDHFGEGASFDVVQLRVTSSSSVTLAFSYITSGPRANKKNDIVDEKQ